MLRKTLSKILFLSSFVGCASMPAPPKGELCVVSVADSGAYCETMSSDMVVYDEFHDYYYVVLPTVANGHFEPFNGMDNWIAVSPETWKEIQIYINKLKDKAKQCQSQNN